MDIEAYKAQREYDREHPCKEKLTFTLEKIGDFINIEDDETNIYHHQRFSIPITIFLQIQTFLETCPIRGFASQVFYEETKSLLTFTRYYVEISRGSLSISRCTFSQTYSSGSASDDGAFLQGDFDLVLKMVDYEIPRDPCLLDLLNNESNYFED